MSDQIGFGSREGTIGGPNIRSVMIEQKRVLLYRYENDDVWKFPGGGPLFGETTKDAIRRHIKKMGGFEIEVQRLLWIIESFFVFRGKPGTLNVEQGTKIHGIGFYFLVSPKMSEGKWQQEEFRGFKRLEMIFKWFKLDELGDINLKPDCLKQLLKHIPNNPKHVVCQSE